MVVWKFERKKERGMERWSARLACSSSSGVLLLLLLLLMMMMMREARSGGTERPVIAVVSQPFDEYDASKGSFIFSYYATFLESAGARVVPLMYDQSDEALQKLLGSVNGVLFTGGGLSLAADTRYFQTEEKIFGV